MASLLCIDNHETKTNRNYTSSLDNGSELGPSEDMSTENINDNIKNDNINNIKNTKKNKQITEVSEENPFGPSSKTQRSPCSSVAFPIAKTAKVQSDMDLSPSPSQASGRIQRIPLESVPPKNNTSTTINDEIHLIRLRNEEEQAFVNLGNKLSAMNAVVADAKNVHKPIRDNLAQAFALYQQLRENREAIALIAVQSTNPDKYAVTTVDREMQTETKIPVQDTFKRAASPTPDADRTNKKVRTADQLQSSENTESEQQWSTVENKKRRLNRKKRRNL